MARTSRSSRAGPTLTATTTTPSISNFARVSKVSMGGGGLAAKKLVGDEYVASAGSRKRKVVVEEATELSKRACVREKENEVCVVTPVKAGLFQDVKELKAPTDLKESSGKKQRTGGKLGVAKTPTKGKKSTKQSSGRIDELFQRARDAAEAKNAPELPSHLTELASLHEAFLKIITLHFAHNGMNVPVDMRAICPNITRTWGKRTVTADDLRTCVAIEGLGSAAQPSPFIISSYGSRKVCVEIDPKLAGASIHVGDLCRRFEENLHALCVERATDEMTDLDIPLANLSLAELPKAPITSLSSTAGVDAILSKGHRALAELKNGMVAKQQSKLEKLAVNESMTNADGSKMCLLDRIRAKALAASQLPAPLSGPELQRRAALQRVEDVAATVSMLSLQDPMPRLAFSMTGLLAKLKDSLRMPMSSEEGVACVRLIAAEVAPRWIQVITIGGRENVVVQRAYQPVDRVIREKVAELLGA
ncbi:uncharacterized protein DNG_00775 [Cephalotrichum gorgonifer]|uniref:DNA replication factor Cdt1 C-terminal domain-containing protein n=1 Tax=Cephalotrichum gorgonifer TaxID=2041049 RepID=A0AAE8MQX2_9PEZI|nr:uncharacterized protein DNG_00775 [Cephalotrichum gorgonifer]